MKTLLLLAITITALAAPPKSEEVLHAEAAGAPPNVVQRIVQLEKTINRLQAELDQRTAAVPATEPPTFHSRGNGLILVTDKAGRPFTGAELTPLLKTLNAAPVKRPQWKLARDVGPGKCRIIEVDGGAAVGGVMDEKESEAPKIVEAHNALK